MISTLSMRDKQTGPFGAHSYSRKAQNLSWILVTAWLPCTSSTEEDTPCAIHTAGWCNGVGLLLVSWK